jgi:serine/threonine protein phosphatase PrpC
MALLKAAAHTHAGYVRSVNQDMAVVSTDLVAIADGMGGHLGGEVAARTAIEELLDEYRQDRSADGLINAARRANRAIWRKSRVDRKLHGMGTTLTAAALVVGPGEEGDSSDEGLPEHLALLNIGDSRAYVLDKASRTLRQLTEDHSVVEEMVRHGELTKEEAAVHPHRHVLTRALGIAPDVILDVWDLDPVVGTRYLLCSDGLTNEVADQEIADVLLAGTTPDDAAKELVGRALAHGGTDNVTVVVLDVASGEIDLSDLKAEMVPPRPPRPENPGLDEGSDITEVVPVTAAPRGGIAGDDEAEEGGPADRRRRRRWGRGTQAAGAGGLAAGAALGGAAAGATAASGEASEVVAGSLQELDHFTGTASGSALGATAADAPAHEPASTAGGAADDHTVLTPEVAAAAAAAAPDAAGSYQPVPGGDGYESGAVEVTRAGGARREGRSMALRAPAPGDPMSHPVSAQVPAQDWPSSGSTPAVAPQDGRGTTAGGRPVVLVPTKRNTNRQRDRIVTFRVLVFVILLAGLLAGTAWVVLWFNQSTYFVTLRDKRVVIYQGRPGGLLWLKPVLIETSQVTESDLLAQTVPVLKAGILESSLSGAENIVAHLKNERLNVVSANTTTSSTSTTSTTLFFTTTTLPTGTTSPTTTVPATTVPTTTVPTTTAPTTTVPATTTTLPATTPTLSVPKSTAKPG